MAKQNPTPPILGKLGRINVRKNFFPSLIKALPAGILTGLVSFGLKLIFHNCPDSICGAAGAGTGVVAALTSWGSSAAEPNSQ